MLTREKLLTALGQLDPAEFEDVINTAYRRRYEAVAVRAERPGPHARPEEFARWIAQRHMRSDAGIERVIYLPAGAPHDEIRLLEVNRLLNALDSDVVEPLDFTPDSDRVSLRVFVADITTDQWERIQRERGNTLPVGWDLEECRTFRRESGTMPTSGL